MAIYGGTLGGGNAWMKIMGIGDPSARKKKGGGLEPILEHHDIKEDPYYMKPPLPTQMK